jgi:hypothetical protein
VAQHVEVDTTGVDALLALRGREMRFVGWRESWPVLIRAREPERFRVEKRLVNRKKRLQRCKVVRHGQYEIKFLIFKGSNLSTGLTWHAR